LTPNASLTEQARVSAASVQRHEAQLQRTMQWIRGWSNVQDASSIQHTVVVTPHVGQLVKHQPITPWAPRCNARVARSRLLPGILSDRSRSGHALTLQAKRAGAVSPQIPDRWRAMSKAEPVKMATKIRMKMVRGSQSANENG
jgi:hypothetical protein